MDLVEEVFAGEKGLSAEQFGQDAPNRPYIHCFGVLTGVENDFRGTIPTRDHILSLLLLFLNVASRESEIADLQVTALVLGGEEGTSSRLLGLRSR